MRSGGTATPVSYMLVDDKDAPFELLLSVDSSLPCLEPVLALTCGAYSFAALLSQLTCPIPTCGEILPIT